MYTSKKSQNLLIHTLENITTKFESLQCSQVFLYKHIAQYSYRKEHKWNVFKTYLPKSV